MVLIPVNVSMSCHSQKKVVVVEHHIPPRPPKKIILRKQTKQEHLKSTDLRKDGSVPQTNGTDIKITTDTWYDKF